MYAKHKETKQKWLFNITNVTERIQLLYSDEKYVENALKSEWDSWNQYSGVVISSQTGSGKTSFIVQNLATNIVDRGKRCLILNNRTALKGQIQLAIEEMKKHHRSENKWDQAVVNKTYQEFLHSYYERFDCIILDEFHFFMADSVFNKETDLILEKIFHSYQNTTNIFISATPEESIYMLCSYLSYKAPAYSQSNGYSTTSFYNKRQLPEGIFKTLSAPIDCNFNSFNLQKYKNNNGQTNEAYNNGGRSFQVPLKQTTGKFEVLNPVEKERIIDYTSRIATVSALSCHTLNSYFPSKDILIYEFARNYDYINSNYFEYDKELEEIIVNSFSSEKWLIFVDSKNTGKKLEQVLNEREVETIYIDSNSKPSNKDNSKVEEQITYDHIVKNHKFKQRVLITTAVIDSGVNIDDKDVKNIVIKCFDKTTFIQMLGRIRVQEHEKINLYIQALNKSQIIKKTNVVENYLQQVKALATSPDLFNLNNLTGSVAVYQSETLNIFSERFKYDPVFHVVSLDKLNGITNNQYHNYKGWAIITWNRLAYAKRYISLQFYKHIIDCMNKKKYQAFSYVNQSPQKISFFEPTTENTEKYYLCKGEEENFEGIGFDYRSYLADLKNEGINEVDYGEDLIEQDITVIEQLSWLGLEHTFDKSRYLSFKPIREKESKKLDLINWLNEHSQFYVIDLKKKNNSGAIFEEKFDLNVKIAISKSDFIIQLQSIPEITNTTQIKAINNLFTENEIEWEIISKNKPYSEWVTEEVFKNKTEDYKEKVASGKETTITLWQIVKKETSTNN